MPEYSEFAGMKCEVQVHTVLNHAWSETAHDITYKKSEIAGFGERITKEIDKRMQKLMEEHLIPAGYEFQKIQYDYQRLIAGENLFDMDIVQEIKAGIDNNQLYNILEQYKEYVLPYYDDISKEVDLIINIVKTAVATARNRTAIPIETPIGSLPGKRSEEVLEISLDILNFVRYVNIEAVFVTLMEFFSRASIPEEQDKINKAVGLLAKYNIDVLRQAGTYVQFTLISMLKKLGSDALVALKDVAFTVCDAALECTAEGTSSTYRTVTFSTVNLIGNDDLEKIRRDALEMLKVLYKSAGTEAEKRKIIGAFNKAGRLPFQGNYDDGLFEIVLKNCVSVVELYIDIVSEEQYEILESIEEDVFFLYRRASDIETREKIETVEKQNQILIEKIEQFKEKLNSDNKYVIYKTLVGFESIFPQDWEDKQKDYSRTEEYRNEKINEFVSLVNKVNETFWEAIILRCAMTKSNDLATFPTFGKFLNKLAQINPFFGISILTKHANELTGFITTIIDGLLKGEGREKAIEIMRGYIEAGKNLYECSRVFEFNKDLDEALLTLLFVKAKELNDKVTLFGILGAIAENHSEDRQHLIGELFLPAIRELTNLKEANWVNYLWYKKNLNAVLSDLDDNQIKDILDNLLTLKSIDFKSEEILFPIAKKYPATIIQFFGRRLKLEEVSDRSEHYDAVPYEFHKLSEPLSSIPDEAVTIVSEWFKSEDYGFFIYRGGQLLKNIFPAFPAAFKQVLITLVQTQEENNILFVLAILRNYKGEPFIQDVCKEIISVLPEDSKLLNEVEVILDSTGVVSGEFGFVEAYEGKKREVESWLIADEDKIRKFAEKYIGMLNRQIASEKRRVEQNIELRKHQYGDDKAS